MLEQHLIKEQAGFRPGKSCTSQLPNLTQHIEDGYQKGMITGAAFVDLSAAYDTVNHRILIQKLYNTTQDSHLCRVFQNMLSNRRFYVELNNERSRWRKQKNGLPQGNVLSPTLDRKLSYKELMHNTKMATRNTLLRKLSNSKWGANASTIRTTALTLCYSVAEYAAPVWARSSHAQKLNPELNSACRAVTGCLKPTNVEDLYLLAGIAPPDIRRYVCARVEKTKQETSEVHSLYGQNQAERRLESRNCFLRSVKPADFPPKVIRCSAWLRRLQAIPHRATVNIDESLAKGFDRPWTTWRCLNRLRTGFTCSKEQRQSWRYYEGDTTYDCGLATENTAHMMQCTLLAQLCSLDDLNKFNDTTK